MAAESMMGNLVLIDMVVGFYPGMSLIVILQVV
eukprot:SAG22_NODE_81_length_21778_cov_38.345173_5_plen_33_part_00